MKTYKVVFHYSVEVEAGDDEQAEDLAWDLFVEDDPTNADYFSATVEEKEEE